VILHTARYSYAGPDRLDITRQGADPRGIVLAPSWDIIKPVLAERQNGLSAARWDRYVIDYTAEMRASYAGTGWTELYACAEFTFVCFCTDPMRCHRTIAADLFVRAGRGRVQYLGERIAPAPAQQSLFP